MAQKQKVLTLQDIKIEYKNQVTTQDYSKKPTIEGIQVFDLKCFSAEDGYFMELGRLNSGIILAVPEFDVKQISYSQVLPGGIKAWHLHFNQEDLWFVPPDDHLLVGLCDLRANSPTSGVTSRIVMGNHKSQLLIIPRGVAHGCANVSHQPITMMYLTNQEFNLEDPDEHRLPYDFLGNDFWVAKKG